MPAPKYAKSVDLNQNEIVNALKQIPGCSVMVIGNPVDLLVGYRAKNILFEIKRPGQRPRTDTQKQFLKDWQGQVRIVTTIEDAIDCVLKIGGR